MGSLSASETLRCLLRGRNSRLLVRKIRRNRRTVELLNPMIKTNSTQVSRDGVSRPRALKGKGVISAAKNHQMARLKHPQHMSMSICTVSLAPWSSFFWWCQDRRLMKIVITSHPKHNTTKRCLAVIYSCGVQHVGVMAYTSPCWPPTIIGTPFFKKH